jgi:lipoprotein-anchoring transpeptidase ErfK/SrfK
MHETRHLLLAMVGASLTLAAAPGWADRTHDPATLAVAPETLKPGQYVWSDTEAGSNEPLSVTIDLTSQRAWVYRGETLIGMSTISSGAAGYETPTGSYTILQKNLTHKSNLYDDASMPFMQRLTWDGLALHAGAIPGHPASHGCVRLPKSFAKLLYNATRLGTTVTISGESPILESEPVETADTMAEDVDSALTEAALPDKLSQR